MFFAVGLVNSVSAIKKNSQISAKKTVEVQTTLALRLVVIMAIVFVVSASVIQFR